MGSQKKVKMALWQTGPSAGQVPAVQYSFTVRVTNTHTGYPGYDALKAFCNVHPSEDAKEEVAFGLINGCYCNIYYLSCRHTPSI